ncbi:hypothetical protein E2C01_013586 [Portunus trituberculatus]|uniref:Uncharacterized protein n=1 Tax=Portunus trituberculatus TaxID=210409 RepID=A0A5B7DHF8_PORTR|nr:hypothetical protein [Portunus trituberculatus]
MINTATGVQCALLQKSALKASWLDALSPNTAVELSCGGTAGAPNTSLKSGVKAEPSGASFFPNGSTLAELLNALKSAHPLLSEVSDMGPVSHGLAPSILPFSSPLLLSNTSAHSSLLKVVEMWQRSVSEYSLQCVDMSWGPASLLPEATKVEHESPPHNDTLTNTPHMCRESRCSDTVVQTTQSPLRPL